MLCLALEHVDAIDDRDPGGRPGARAGRPVRAGAVPPAPPGSRERLGRRPDPGEHYWRIGAYLARAGRIDEVAPGVDLRFVHRPLSRYVHAMGEAGLLIDDMEEPAPPASLVRTLWQFAEAATIPRVLLLRARIVAREPT